VRLVGGLWSGDRAIQFGELRGRRCRDFAFGAVFFGELLARRA